MTLRRRSRRRQAARKLSRTAKTIRSLALGRMILAVLKRRRALAFTGSPVGLAAGGVVLAVLTRRRRRARRFEADLGPPNQSAPGSHVPPPVPQTTPSSDPVAPAPNEGAPGHEPTAEEPLAAAQEPAPPGGESAATLDPSAEPAAQQPVPDEPVTRQPMG